MGSPLRITATAVLCSTLVVLSACGAPASPAAAPSVPAASPSPVPAKKLTGAVVYLARKGNSLELHTVRGGADSTVTIATDGGMCPYNSVVVSPDGQHLAWVSGVDGGGKLVVSDPNGTNRRTLPVGVVCLGSTALVWTGPTQLSVMPQGTSSQRVLVDITTGKTASKADDADAYSDDMAWEANLDPVHRKPEVFPVGNPGAARPYTYTPPADEAEHYDGWSARSVSVDGRYVAVGWNGTDPSRQLGTFAVVDTTTGAPVSLPVSDKVSSVHFLADGTVLVQTDSQIVLLDKDFKALDQVTVPASVHGLPVLRYLS